MLDIHKRGLFFYFIAATLVLISYISEAAAKSDRPLPADELVASIHGEIESLIEAVRRSDKSGMARLAKSIQARLAVLKGFIADRPAYSISIDERAVRIVTLGMNAEPAEIAKQLAIAPETDIELSALRTKAVGSLDWFFDDIEPFSMTYYPPARVFLATPKGFFPSDANLLYDPLQLSRSELLAERHKQLEIAWNAAHELSIPVRQDLAQQWKLTTPLLRMKYFDSGLVSPQGETYQELLDEVTRQLAYIVNVKFEGPPLIRALQTGLFFKDEFGFMAWGGRWPAFDGKVFFLRYDPVRDSFLVRLDQV